MLRLLTWAAVLIATTQAAEVARSVILTESRAGIVEFIDPATFASLGRFHIRLPAQSSGLNGIAAGADGLTLYLEGPLPDEVEGCCVLCAVDLATLKARRAASIPGSRSRRSFVLSDGIVYRSAALTTNAELDDGTFHLSPDRRRLVAMRKFQRPTIDYFDLAGGGTVRQKLPQGNPWAVGAWSGDRFFAFAHGGAASARLLMISSAGVQENVPVASPDFGGECSTPAFDSLTATENRLVVYEAFGFTTDRRPRCGQVPGGAWFVDPATGALTGRVAPDLHFSSLVAGHAGALFGLSVEAKLVHIDAKKGRVVKTLLLDPGVVRIAVADLREIPAGDVLVEWNFDQE